MTAVTVRLRAWYLITLSLVPPLWSVTKLAHLRAHRGSGFRRFSYLALALSPVLFEMGTRRLFRLPQRDSPTP